MANNTALVGGILLLGAIGAVVFIGTTKGRPSPCGNAGDVNGDGRVTKKDARLVAQHLLGEITLTLEQQLRAKVSFTLTQGITDLDFILIADYVEGNINTFPVCNQPF